jgi:hypothetical protein
MGISLAQLVSGGGGMRGPAPSEGPVTYTNVALDGDRVLACTQLGLYLVREGETRLAIFVARTERGYKDGIKLEVLASERSIADACLAALRSAMRKRNVYRGHIVSLSANNRKRCVDPTWRGHGWASRLPGCESPTSDET